MAASFGIVGCGYVGSAVATHLRRQGHELVGTTTSPGRLAELCDLVDHPRLYSAGDPMADASFLDRLDGVLIAMAPTTATFEEDQTRRFTARRYRPLLKRCVSARDVDHCMWPT